MSDLTAPTICRLCGLRKAIKRSHVIPAFVFRAIKRASPTGFLRFGKQPNRRVQDGDSIPLLCEECEARFSKRERLFANAMEPFYSADCTHIDYGEWMHYFLTSLAWRTLVLDLPGISADPTVPRKLIQNLEHSQSMMSDYLLERSNNAELIRHHVLLFIRADNCSPDLARLGINVKIRCSAFGYVLYNKLHCHAVVVHNLAGIICVLVIKGNPQDIWEGTKIKPTEGTLEPPREVASWVIGDIIDLLKGVSSAQISESQHSLIIADVKKKPNAAALRFHRADLQLRNREPL